MRRWRGKEEKDEKVEGRRNWFYIKVTSAAFLNSGENS